MKLPFKRKKRVVSPVWHSILISDVMGHVLTGFTWACRYGPHFWAVPAEAMDVERLLHRLGSRSYSGWA